MNKNNHSQSLRGFIIGLSFAFLIIISALGGAVADRLFEIKPLNYLTERTTSGFRLGGQDGINQKILKEESAVIDVAEKMSPSVVTVTIETPKRRVLEFNPFEGLTSRIEGGEPQDIGSGFIVSGDGLIVTNKHVVSESQAEYKVVTKEGEEYQVEKISRDPSNDLAILKIEANNLPAVELGDSDQLKVGQFVIAIGTALGEFRHTVTTGVISGLGRGIEAGNPYEGYVERLDDVIQTDAAINPGNSGGPLLNSAGQVIGVNVAVAQLAQNIGFALPVNVLKSALETFNKTGSFASKPFIGVEYQMIPQDTAILNDLPQGAYIVNVISGSPAENAGIKEGDIIVKFAGEDVKDEEDGLSKLIENKKAGDRVEVELYRDDQMITLQITLSDYSQD